MTYGDIARALTKTLTDLFPGHRIYSMARVEKIERPAFFFSMKPVLVEAANMRTRHNVLSVYIDYFQSVKDEAGMYDAATVIRDTLGWSYPVGDHYVNVQSFDWEFVGTERNVIEISITLDYFDAVDTDEKADLMEDVHVNVETEDPVGKPL